MTQTNDDFDDFLPPLLVSSAKQLAYMTGVEDPDVLLDLIHENLGEDYVAGVNESSLAKLLEQLTSKR